MDQVARLSVRTERLAGRVLQQGITTARAVGVTHLDQVILALHAKVKANSRAVRLLWKSNEGNEGFGLYRSSLEALTHLCCVVVKPLVAIELLRAHLVKVYASIPEDAETVLIDNAASPQTLLAALYGAHCSRHKQKNANDLGQSTHLGMKSSESAPEVASSIASRWTEVLGATLWSVVSKEKHWYPAGYGHGAQSTKQVMRYHGLETMYVVPFRQSSSVLHAVDYSDYLDGELQRVQYPRALLVVASAQESLCASIALVCRHYGFANLLHAAQGLYSEGDRLRKRF